MTIFQLALGTIGFARFKFYRRWVGGRWAERCSETAPHLFHHPNLRWRWVPDPHATFDHETHAIEQWPMKLPRAQGRYRS